jgi:hypothetical protein
MRTSVHVDLSRDEYCKISYNVGKDDNGKFSYIAIYHNYNSDKCIGPQYSVMIFDKDQALKYLQDMSTYASTMINHINQMEIQ